MAKTARKDFPPELHEQLRDPLLSSRFWSLVDQISGRVIPFDPNRIAPKLQHTMINFVANTPRMPSVEEGVPGKKRWLGVVASRQTGKSRVSALAVANAIAHNPGQYGAVLADKEDRAIDLFMAILDNQRHMRPDLKVPTVNPGETRQISYYHGGKVRTLTAGASMVGIGRAVDALQWSEVPFCAHAGEVWHGLYPAMRNRSEALVIMESTPAQLHHGGAEFYRDLMAEARVDQGSRFMFLFSAMYESRLNEEPWPKSWTPTIAEQRLLDRFGPGGVYHQGRWADCPVDAPGEVRYMTLQNLAFLRQVRRDDPEVRRNPELVRVFYPFDPLTCWQRAGSAAVPARIIRKVEERSPILVPWDKESPFKRYEEPIPGAQYVLCVDPSGWVGGDPAAFHVLKVYDDLVEQVATYASNQYDPHYVAQLVIEEARYYNDALVIAENNGVGGATMSLLQQAESRGALKRLYYDKIGQNTRPGIAAQGKLDKAFAAMLDVMLDSLVLHDEETVEQLTTYRRDKKVQQGENQEILNPGKLTRGRRRKHHWDRVSALYWGCYAIMEGMVPRRYRPRGGANEAEAVRNADLLPADTDHFDDLDAQQQREVMAELQRRERAERKEQRRLGREAARALKGVGKKARRAASKGRRRVARTGRR